jgi:hypothetical protein
MAGMYCTDDTQEGYENRGKIVVDVGGNKQINLLAPIRLIGHQQQQQQQQQGVKTGEKLTRVSNYESNENKLRELYSSHQCMQHQHRGVIRID